MSRMHVTAITVMGEHDTEYTISVTPSGEAHCSCPAYRFSLDTTCKHIRFLTRALLPCEH